MTKKYLLVAVFLFLTACNEYSNNSTDPLLPQVDEKGTAYSGMKHPKMDERVVAYVGGVSVDGVYQITTDMDVLKEQFQKALNEDNFDSECNYFAVSVFAPGSLEYFVVSKDSKSDSLAVYNVWPSIWPNVWPVTWPNLQDNSSMSTSCVSNDMPFTYGFLICDKEGGLKDRVMLPPIGYNDPAWDCDIEKHRPQSFFEFRE